MSSLKSAEGSSIYSSTVLILAVILVAVAGAGIRVLYVMTLEDMRENLAELAWSRARVLEAVAKYDACNQSGGTEGAARSATLSQLKEGHRGFAGFRSTAEIILAERIGDEFHVDPDRRESIRYQWEVGIALAKRDRPIRIWFLDFEHIGLAYRFSSDRNLSAITLNLRSPFTH